MSAGRLFMVGTPIGHLGDLTFRALETLQQASVVVCEDTRRTRRLLTHYRIERPLVSLHAHSAGNVVERLLDRVAAGESVAYVTDAGTPVISDPGGQLAERAHARGLTVVPIPGPGAVLAALSAAGFPADRFLFCGFLPRRGTARSAALARIAESDWTAVCYEAPGRVAQLLADLAAACGGERQAAVARELTKLHEEVRRGTLAELQAYYGEHAPRGEITVVIGGGSPVVAAPASETSATDVAAALAELKGTGAPAAVAKELARRLGISRQDAYRLLTR